MKKEIAERWVSALRSGEYKQGRLYLKSERGYCCLGVLCDILGVEWAIDDRKIESYTVYEVKDGKDGKDGKIISTLPKEIMKKIGWSFSSIKDRLGYVGNQFSLTALNDTGKSFDEIANVIEKHYQEL